MFGLQKRNQPETVIIPEILKRPYPKIQTKLNYVDFEDWYLSHPGVSAPEIADRFGVSVRCIYNKMKRFNKRYERKVDSKLSSMTLIAYKEGYRQGMTADVSARELIAYKEGYNSGMLVGAGLGGLIADLLKSKGMGISDIVEMIVNSMKGNDGNNTQTPKDTGTQTP